MCDAGRFFAAITQCSYFSIWWSTAGLAQHDTGIVLASPSLADYLLITIRIKVFLVPWAFEIPHNVWSVQSTMNTEYSLADICYICHSESGKNMKILAPPLPVTMRHCLQYCLLFSPAKSRVSDKFDTRWCMTRQSTSNILILLAINHIIRWEEAGA